MRPLTFIELVCFLPAVRHQRSILVCVRGDNPNPAILHDGSTAQTARSRSQDFPPSDPCTLRPYDSSDVLRIRPAHERDRHVDADAR